MRRSLLATAILLLGFTSAAAQVRVNPTGVSVNAQNATTVFLTFGNVRNLVPTEALWCGELIPATPDIGLRCDPNTLYGSLPLRYDLSRRSGRDALTDIMSIPPSVARRAYVAAERGVRSTFFYVRRFENPSGGPDEYVAVTCRLTGGGARTPFALTDVELSFDPKSAVAYVKPGEAPAPFSAKITYNGSGRLKGRWEVVLPGEEPPSTEDLLTEATLPADQRGTQRRFTQIERFNVFLPPTGSAQLPGPDVARLPVNAEGAYLVLLRVEADDEREGNSDLPALGAGDAVVHSGAVAGFPLPVLRYMVGGGDGTSSVTFDDPAARGVRVISPRDEAFVARDSVLELRWIELAGATRYRVELAKADGSDRVFTAFVARGRGRYRVPPFVWDSAGGPKLRWWIVALDAAGRELRRSDWRIIQLVASPPK
jgi:hypothetical protein